MLKSFGELWKESVIKYGPNIAVSDEQTQYTYQQVNEYLEMIHGYLAKRKIVSGERVAIETVNKAQTWIFILAILTYGCSYVPIDREYPENRKKFMREDSRAACFLSEKDCEKILKDGEGSLKFTVRDSLNSPAYVIYTSGTTGIPKGVELYQEELLNLCNWYIDTVGLGAGSKVLSLNALSFDASVKNLFAPLLVGARVIMNIENPRDIYSVVKAIEKHQPTHVNGTPSLLQLLLEEDRENGYQAFSSTECIITGGEAFKKAELAELYKNKHIKIVNVYGPTECTSVSSFHVVNEKELLDKESEIPIGRAIPKKELYVVNEKDELCATNEKGELYIGGIGIAKGYINAETKTREKFVQFQGRYVYKSGDLCYRNDEGNLYYCGRIDQQIKLNGYRIELEEIASQIEKLEQVKTCSCLFVNDTIVACYCEKEQITEEEIKKSLRTNLPEYMIPKQFVVVSSIPVTERGKADIPELTRYVEQHVFTVQETKEQVKENKIQSRIAAIWKKLLCLPVIDEKDNFFDIGGNSLKLFKMGKMLEKEFSIRIEPMYLMELSSIKKVTEFIESQIEVLDLGGV